MVILTMLYFAFVEYKKGYALGWSLVFINAIAVVFYILFPVSVYWWHQDLLAHPIAFIPEPVGSGDVENPSGC